MNILRITRHAPTQEQLQALQAVYGDDVNVITINATISSAADAKKLVRQYRADAVEVVLPLHLLEQVVKEVGVPVIRSVTVRQGKNKLVFSHYEQIHSVVTKTTPLDGRRGVGQRGQATH